MFMCLLFVNPSFISEQSKKRQSFILKGKLDTLKEEKILQFLLFLAFLKESRIAIGIESYFLYSCK